MEPKDRFDRCMKLAEFAAGRWDARRSYEWKLSLGLWALLAAAIHSLRVEAVPGWIPAVIILLYVFWMNNVWWANYLDRMMMRAYRRQCTMLLNADGIVYEDKYYVRAFPLLHENPKINRLFGFLMDWAVLFQIAVTTLLVLLAYHYCQVKMQPFSFPG
jgi:hypothetical protein